MKKMIVGLIILTSIISYMYILIYGSPWGRYRFRIGVNAYLQNKYVKEMSIDEIHYSFKEGNYWATVSPKGQTNLKFRVEPLKNQNKYKDDYFVNSWKYQVSSNLTPLVQRTFSKDDYAYIKIPTNPLNNVYREKIDIIPSFEEIRNKITGIVSIRIVIARKFKQDKSNEEFLKMIEIIKMIKDKNYLPDEVVFSFSSDLDNPADWTTFKCNYSNLVKMDSVNQLIEYLSQVKN